MGIMNTGLSTKAWSSNPQETFKADDKNYTGANATGLPEGKDIGTYLNEIADPNYVDPALKKRDVKNELDKDAFFKLMLAQIKHQDPMNPMKSDEMAANLAQFTSLEQLMNMNQKLDGLTKAQQPATQFQALNFIGKSIGADTSKIARNVGDKTHDLRFTLPKDADKIKITIKNEAGEEVRAYDLTGKKKGEQKLTWNGLNNLGNTAPAGDYYFEIAAEGQKGEKIAVQTHFKGKVTGVNYTSAGPVLLVGDQSVRLSDVQKIEDSELKSDFGAKEAQAVEPALKNPNETNEDKLEGAKPAYKGNLDSIAMSQQMIDQTNKAQEELARMKK